MGRFAVGDATLNRFFSLHYLLPFIIAGVVGLHIWALHVPGNNNPLGIDVKSPQDTVPFHPYYTVKDALHLILFVMFFAAFVFYEPEFFGSPDNNIPADPLVTPPDIVPEWYLLPFYAMLRSVPDKLLGVIVMGAAIVSLAVLPWTDTSRVRSNRFPSDHEVVLLDLRGRLRDPGLLRLAAGRRHARSGAAGLGGPSGVALLFRLHLPDHVLRRLVRNTQAASGVHCPIRARRQAGRCRVRHTMRLALRITLAAGLALGLTGAASAQELDTHARAPKHAEFEFEGPLGTYDRAALQRGFQVYKEVCGACHSLKRIAFRNLTDEGGQASPKPRPAPWPVLPRYRPSP